MITNLKEGRYACPVWLRQDTLDVPTQSQVQAATEDYVITIAALRNQLQLKKVAVRERDTKIKALRDRLAQNAEAVKKPDGSLKVAVLHEFCRRQTMALEERHATIEKVQKELERKADEVRAKDGTIEALQEELVRLEAAHTGLYEKLRRQEDSNLELQAEFQKKDL